MRAPTRSVPHAVEECDRVRGGEQIRERPECAREPVHGIEQPRQGQHRVEHGRTYWLGESRRRYKAGDHETEGENAERAEKYGRSEAEHVHLPYSRKKSTTSEHEQQHADHCEGELHHDLRTHDRHWRGRT